MTRGKRCPDHVRIGKDFGVKQPAVVKTRQPANKLFRFPLQAEQEIGRFRLSGNGITGNLLYLQSGVQKIREEMPVMFKSLFTGDVGVKVYHRDGRGQNYVLRLNGACFPLGYPGQHFVGEKGLYLNPCNPGLEYRGNPGLMLTDPKQPADFQTNIGFTEKKPVSGNLIHLAGHLKRRGVLLFEKVHQSGEGLILGLNPGCSQKKRQHTG
jgi:hypothetical protein